MKNIFKKTLRDARNLLYIFLYIWDTRKSWWFSATARTKARFARTILGGFWQGISNVSFIIALAIVYGVVFKVANFREYMIYIGLGFVVWIYISNSLVSAPELFSRNASQINNTNINHIFYALEDWAFQLQNFFQSLLVVLGSLALLRLDILLNIITVGILPTINIIFFTFWFPLLISLGGIRYKDFYQLIPIIVQLIFLLSPFLYVKKNLGSLSWIADFNPFYLIVADFRDVIISGQINLYKSFHIFIINILGTLLAIYTLDKFKNKLPFLI